MGQIVKTGDSIKCYENGAEVDQDKCEEEANVKKLRAADDAYKNRGCSVSGAGIAAPEWERKLFSLIKSGLEKGLEKLFKK